MNKSSHDGSCHCKAARFRYTTENQPDSWSVRACQCRFCRMHDALSTSDPSGGLQFIAEDPAVLQRYRFALKTADFLICKCCGCYIGAVIDTAHGRFGIINTRAFDSVPADLGEVAAISYDDEDIDGRISRREHRWTPVTAMPS